MHATQLFYISRLSCLSGHRLSFTSQCNNKIIFKNVLYTLFRGLPWHPYKRCSENWFTICWSNPLNIPLHCLKSRFTWEQFISSGHIYRLKSWHVMTYTWTNALMFCGLDCSIEKQYAECEVCTSCFENFPYKKLTKATEKNFNI